MLEIQPVSVKAAIRFVEAHHRHHGHPGNHLWAVAVGNGDEVRGVAIVAFPAARMSNDGWTAEVVRCCTLGDKNACSMLYGAAWRAARALGFRRLITYTLPCEGGASLRASGFQLIGQRGGGRWSRKGRPRVDDHPLEPKLRWEKP